MSIVGAPVTIRVVNPRNDDGETLDDTNATAVITISTLRGTVEVAPTPMVWDATYLRWEYEWDTTGAAAGRYRARVDVTPTDGIATPRFLTIDLAPIPAGDPADLPGLNAGPCDPWPVNLCCDVDGVDQATIDRMVMAATEVYWGLSGRQFGLCTIPAIRPCRRSCFEQWGGLGWSLWGGGNPFSNGWAPGGWQSRSWWFPPTCGRCSGDCSCTTVEEIALPGPVAEIVQVKLDGEIMATGSYRVDNWDTLVRTDGGTWPLCQDMSLPDTEPNTMSVTVRVGKKVPTLGELAVGELACVFIAGCRPNQVCAVPDHLIAQTRAGFSQAFTAVSELVKEGLVGGEMGDLFLRTFNPSRLQSRSTVHSPDYRPARRAGT